MYSDWCRHCENQCGQSQKAKSIFTIKPSYTTPRKYSQRTWHPNLQTIAQLYSLSLCSKELGNKNNLNVFRLMDGY